jgi:tRNA (mo5U34)-methyltransferase
MAGEKTRQAPLAFGRPEARLTISELLARGAEFAKTMGRLKAGVSPGFEWYPYDTLSALWHLEKLLTGERRGLLTGRGRVLDLGSQDGELAFFLESLGYQVIAADHPAYNHNGMRGIRALKAALGSSIEIYEIDLDRPFTLPHDTYDLVILFGVLYHLRNPFYVLEELARRATHLVLSTRIARRYPDGAPMPPGHALAYLLRENELNQDDSNYFIFSEPALRVLLERCHWEVRDFLTQGATGGSDPIRLDRDERAFCFARTRYDRLSEVDLLEGWHDLEDTGWRWTARTFTARVRAAESAQGRVLTMRLYVAEESVRRLKRLTLSAMANGIALEPAVYETAGLATFVRRLDVGMDSEIVLRFWLDRALPSEEADSRERGIIVTSIQIE